MSKPSVISLHMLLQPVIQSNVSTVIFDKIVEHIVFAPVEQKIDTEFFNLLSRHNILWFGSLA